MLKKIRELILPPPIIQCSVTTSAPNECLKDEVVVVTGGGSGIGRAVAIRAASLGACVIVLGRREHLLKEVAMEIGEEHCRYFVYDVTQADGGEELFEKLESIFGRRITAVVNNAGIYIDKKPTEFTVDDFDSVITTNLKAPMFMSIAFVKYCKKYEGKGNIVMTASNRGLFPDYGPYGVSKKGIIHYAEGLARELIGTGIRVNAVAPGMTASEINGRDIAGDMYTNSARGKRVLMPEEIAEIICFLLSGYSACMNGATIPCDEGDCLR